MTPKEVLALGVAELATVLEPAGFIFVDGGEESTSGGPSATGDFLRGDRRLELHVRFSLSLVRYHFDDYVISHEDLVRGVRGTERIAGPSEYPGFSDDPMAGFRHFRADLERFGAVFLTGGARAFRALKKWLDKNPRKTGLAGLEPDRSR
ncbi:MAG TPA: hypothetical protein VHG72_20160 [Polyangia bacterium]|nr:hypothetical protein [Polyangia bacterium]